MKWISVIDLKARNEGGMEEMVFAQLDKGLRMGPRKARAALWMGPPNPDDNWWRNNASNKPRWLDWFLSLSDRFPVPKACLACGASHPHANGYCSTVCAKEEWKRLEVEATERAIEHRRQREERSREIAAAKAAKVEERAERQRLLLERRAAMQIEIDARMKARAERAAGKRMEQEVKRVMEEARRQREAEAASNAYNLSLQKYRESINRKFR